MKIFLAIVAFISFININAQTTTSDVWINEFHYDGITTYGQSDVNEFVELVMKTSIASNPTELAKYTLVLYSSRSLDNMLLTVGRGMPYNVASPLYTGAETIYPLSGFQSCPSNVAEFTMLSQSMSNLQDVPAAMAIIYNGTVVIQLLSYEKSFKISPAPNGGAASDLTTSLILNGLAVPAMETSLSQTNHSIALTGTGSSYSQFVWDDNVLRTSSPCAVNAGQTLVAGVLPVTLLSFDASKTDENGYLTWQISSPLNLNNFDIERSSDGNSFTKIGDINFMSGQSTYSFTDKATLNGKNFYRLKMIDTDGRFKYSLSRLLNFDSKNIFVVSPNPAQNFITLKFDNSMQDAQVRIIDKQGRIVKQLRINASNRKDVDVSDLSSGIYIVEVVSTTNHSLQKLIISK